jgi:MoaA/NifB/PqqE/SkfB family radical SAM enzyme
MDVRTLLEDLSISPKGLSRYQRAANFLKLLNGYSPFPLDIDLMLTLRCNLKCDICVNQQEDFVAILSAYREPELSVAEWKDIIRDIDQSFYFKPNLNLLGGEPSVYEGYLDIVGFIKRQGFRCSYTTNGTFLARDAARIVSAGVDVILVSIDGRRDVHNGIRGPGVFEKAIEGMRAINELRRAQDSKAPQVFLNCVINSDSCDHLECLVDIAEELGVDYVSFLHLRFPDSEIGRHGVDVSHVIEGMARAKRRGAESGVSVNFYPHLRSDQIATYYLQPSQELGRGCISPWLRMIIVPNGKIITCRDRLVGDWRNEGTTMKGVWNGSALRALRHRLARSKVLPDCGRCCRKQY